MELDEVDESKKISGIKKELVVARDGLPLRITYRDKRYILILTRNDKLILNKATE